MTQFPTQPVPAAAQTRVWASSVLQCADVSHFIICKAQARHGICNQTWSVRVPEASLREVRLIFVHCTVYVRTVAVHRTLLSCLSSVTSRAELNLTCYVSLTLDGHYQLPENGSTTSFRHVNICRQLHMT